jgi:hypothetical protein
VAEDANKDPRFSLTLIWALMEFTG